MKWTEQYHVLKEAPMHIRAITGVMIVTVVIALIAFGMASMAVGSVRHAH